MSTSADVNEPMRAIAGARSSSRADGSKLRSEDDAPPIWQLRRLPHHPAPVRLRTAARAGTSAGVAGVGGAGARTAVATLRRYAGKAGVGVRIVVVAGVR
ncbi:hypothetical protein V499_00883 [Pseudogymnoascus sp. VKM F-103]|nr:hypothetical protein V499_00883 [Pseudogymnoascus sp. VKM F-103]